MYLCAKQSIKFLNYGIRPMWSFCGLGETCRFFIKNKDEISIYKKDIEISRKDSNILFESYDEYSSRHYCEALMTNSSCSLEKEFNNLICIDP